MNQSSLTVDLGPASPAEIEEVERQLDTRLPADYKAFVVSADGTEGWIGGTYVAFWPVARLVEFNLIVRCADFAPGLLLFATNGGGEGYGFDARGGEWSVVKMQIVGMAWELGLPMAPSFTAFLEALAATTNPPEELDESALGNVIHEIKPVIVGGSPTDPANKILMPLADYLPLTAWWNDRITEMRQSR